MAPDRAEQAERWVVDTGPVDVVQLHIPPHARRDRHFEIFCSVRVACPAEADDAWHALRVLVNGAQRWTRQVDSHPGGPDSLDYRFRHTLAIGEALRIVATSRVFQATRTGMSITAEEDLSD